MAARRAAIISATLDSISEQGFASTTIKVVASRAGITGGLVIHYFGGREGLMEAVFRSMLKTLSERMILRLREATTARQRLQAIIDCNLDPQEFDNMREGNAWLAFWGQVRYVACLRRIQRIYQKRLLSNLRHELRCLIDADNVQCAAVMVAAMIDGIWLRAALSDWTELSSSAARSMVRSLVASITDQHQANITLNI
ncbi:transcriptional regulator BetI [Novosphingobium flavum]|uniref:Transcriptional regulator BetI n=1 Tax=Novosphingobium aerophilum TaxID=2839843 RepID=A0A7X1F9B3_9SPHN|nr:transcriptional regulator BetI [Novosphingobium aerophilum]MBC2652781.1 transcriptional regulator BetI [Novosphingobium aerophilum]MBC2660828.1 transcriptional regulator BetI [Novosphingobium aerophilum]